MATYEILALNESIPRIVAPTSGDTGTIKNLEVTTAATIASADINGGTIDGATIGASSASTGAFTTLTTSGNVTLGDATTDTVTVNGYMGIGGSPNSTIAVNVASAALTGTNQVGAQFTPVATSAATSSVRGVYSRGDTAAASFTTSASYAFYAADPTKGAGSTITSLHGLYISDQTQGTNNYGITSAVSSGTNKWNIYASGTAANYFAGNVGIGTASPSAVGTRTTAHINGSAGAALRLSDDTGNTYLDYTDTSGARLFVNAAEPLLLGTNSLERLRIDSSGNVGIGTSSPATKLDVNDDSIRVRTSQTPASASATGNQGEIAWDADYIYVCTATNTWKRVAIATW